MRLATYGAAEGPLVVYFHGVPGAPEEVARFDAVARSCGVRLVGLDRGTFAPGLTGEPYFGALASELAEFAGVAPMHLVGFSLGAFVALGAARGLGARASSLDLISAAAPLELGDFLPGMAGRPVFTLARNAPALFGAMTALQGALASRAPDRVFRMLFATAAGEDGALADDPAFRNELGKVLRASLGRGHRGYLRDVRSYVRPWADKLSDISVETRLWHGREDNWAPLAMAGALKDTLPAVRRLEVSPGRSHYSCLFDAMPRVLERIGRGAE